MIKAILFDFDGTLADTAPGIVNNFQETFRHLGLPIPDEGSIRQTIGRPLFDAIRDLGNLDDKAAQEATDLYRKIFYECELTKITLFPDVPQTVRCLVERGIRLAICTSRNAPSLGLILERNNLNECFEDRITNSDGLPPKPAPDMVLALLSRMNLAPEEALVVGDTTFDIEMGNRAGCPTVAVTYGNHTPDQLLAAHPTCLIDNITALPNLL